MISILWLIVILLLAIPFITEDEKSAERMPIIGIVILYFITARLIWMLLDTKYRIKEKQLFYCSVPIRGSIEIETIRKIERWNKWYVTSLLKPALEKTG